MEFSTRAAELTTLLESRITHFYTNFQMDEIGRVVSVGDGIARVYGFMMEGIMDLHHDIFFFLILILVFVSRILVRALWAPLFMNRHTAAGNGSEASTSGSDNNKERDRKILYDHISSLVVDKVIEYLNTYDRDLIKEFPGATNKIGTNMFIQNVVREILSDVGLKPNHDPRVLKSLLQASEKALRDNFQNVNSYNNNVIYASIVPLLKDCRTP